MTASAVNNITSVSLNLQSAAAAGAENERPYDSAGAAVFVVIVVTLYGLSIVLLLLFHVKGYDNSEDKQIDKYLKLQPTLRRQAEKDSFINLRNQIGVRLFVRKFHAWLESTEDESEDPRNSDVENCSHKPTLDKKQKRYVDVLIEEEMGNGREGEYTEDMDIDAEMCEIHQRPIAEWQEDVRNFNDWVYGDPWTERQRQSNEDRYGQGEGFEEGDDDVDSYDYYTLEGTESDSVLIDDACYCETTTDDDFPQDSGDEYSEDNWDDTGDCDCATYYMYNGDNNYLNAAYSNSNSNSYDDRGYYLMDGSGNGNRDPINTVSSVYQYYRYVKDVSEVDRLLDSDDVSLTTRITAV